MSHILKLSDRENFQNIFSNKFREKLQKLTFTFVSKLKMM